MSFTTGEGAKRRRIDSFFTKVKAKAPEEKDGAAATAPVPFELPKPTNNVNSQDLAATCTAEGLVVVELPRNRTGFWVLDMERLRSGALKLRAIERFNVYAKLEEQSAAFGRFVQGLPDGRVVCIAITDTAMAATRPLKQDIYDTLRMLGAPAQLEPIGYRQPFAFIGVKGSAQGSAMVSTHQSAAMC